VVWRRTPRRARKLLRADRAGRRRSLDGGDARGELRSADRHRGSGRRRRCGGRDAGHRLRAHRRRLHARPGPRGAHPGADGYRLGVLELLRPRQPAFAVVRPRPFRAWRDAVDAGYPRLSAAEGVASTEPGMKDDDPLAANPPAARLLGRRVIAVDRQHGAVELAFTAAPDFANRHGFVQGGMLAAMLDSTVGCAAVAALDGQSV